MVIGAYIGMMVVGVIALVTGKMTLTRRRVVRGTPARLLALLAFAPLPLTFLMGAVMGIIVVMRGLPVEMLSTDSPGFNGVAAVISLAAIVVCIIEIYVIGMALADPPE